MACLKIAECQRRCVQLSRKQSWIQEADRRETMLRLRLASRVPWSCWINLVIFTSFVQCLNSPACDRLAGCAFEERRDNAATTIYFGLMLSFPDPQNRASLVGAFDDGHDIAPAVYLAVEQINNRKDLLSDYQVELVRADGGCNVTERSVIGIHELACSCKPIVGIIGPTCGTSSMVVSQITASPEFSLTTIHYGQREILGNRSLFPFAFGILGSQAIYVDALVDLVKQNNWTRLALLYSEDDIDIARSMVIQERIEELSDFEISFATAIYDNHIPLREIRETFTRVIVILGTPGITLRTVCLGYHEHMMFPNYQWVFVERIDTDFHNISFPFGGKTFNCSDSDIINAIDGSVNLLFGSVGDNDSMKETDIGVTLEEYQQGYSAHVEEYRDEFNVSSNVVPWAKGFYDAAWSLAFALNSSLEELGVNPTQLKTGSNVLARTISKYMVTLDFSGISGRINFDDETGYNKYTTVDIYQYRPNISSIRVGVYNRSGLSVFSDTVPIFISALFEERFIQVDKAVAAVLFTITVLILPLTVTLQIINVIYRKNKPIKAASPLLNHLIFTGCYFIEVSVILYVLTETYKNFSSNIREYFCNMIPWFLATGSTLIIGTVFVKTWRLHRIYTQSKKFMIANMAYMNNKLLGGLVLILAFVDLVVCLLWALIDKLRINTTKTTQLLRGEEFPVVLVYETCGSRFAVYWLIALLSPKLILTLVSFFLALLTRFNMKEFRTINVVIFVYLLTIVSGVMLPLYIILSYVVSVNLSISVLIICLFLNLLVYFCVLILLLPPVYILVRK